MSQLSAYQTLLLPIFAHLVLLPALGGLLAWQALAWTLQPLPLYVCWTRYLAASCCAALAVIPLDLVLRRTSLADSVSNDLARVILMAALVLIQVILIPLFLGRTRARVVGMLAAAVVLANAATYLVVRTLIAD